MNRLKYVGINPVVQGQAFKPQPKPGFLCLFCGKVHLEQGAKCDCKDSWDVECSPNWRDVAQERQKYFVAKLSRRRFMAFTSREDAEWAERNPDAAKGQYEKVIEAEERERNDAIKRAWAIAQAEREKQERIEREEGRLFLEKTDFQELIRLALDNLEDLAAEYRDWAIRPGVRLSDLVHVLRHGRKEKFYGVAENPGYDHTFVWNGPARDTGEEARQDVAAHQNEFSNCMLSYVIMKELQHV